MIKLQNIQDYLCSESVISEISNTGRWSWHGTRIQEYFNDEWLTDEYCNTRDRKRIIKQYLFEKSVSIHKDLISESPEKLYRAIYLEKGCVPDTTAYHGVFWSSNPNTSACVQSDCNQVEWLLEVDFTMDLVDWNETLRSRIDYIHGDREQEFQIKKGLVVNLVAKSII
ncbi:hypothetical protein LMH73_020875 [Vibrio splendidus]|nr:hypothetical protein [Vibrio splendidus]MCC4880356.1 hypothetical protein [Vibrio splendidus]